MAKVFSVRFWAVFFLPLHSVASSADALLRVTATISAPESFFLVTVAVRPYVVPIGFRGLQCGTPCQAANFSYLSRLFYFILHCPVFVYLLFP